MPGNEVGDRVQNLFGQDNLSQDQHHPQVIGGNWPHLSNNQWVVSQRQIGSPYNSNLKNCNVQQSDVERGHGSQSYHTPHGLARSNLKPEFSRIQSQNQQHVVNGFVHGNHVFQTRQNETNFLGVDTESNRHNLTSRGLSTIELENGNGSEQKNFFSRRVGTSESPVSFDFLGGQQHMSSEQLGMLQSLPRQQPGISDMQLLQRHIMLAQMQEFNRQQQLQQLEVRQGARNHSPSTGVSINEAPNHSLQSELMAGNANYIQPAASLAMQGSPGGHMLSAEQGQALQMMGLAPQQMDQSLYTVPLSSPSGTSGCYPNMQMDKMPMKRIPANSSSFSGNAYAESSDQVSLQGGSKVFKLDFQRKNMFGSSSGQSTSTGPNFENLHQGNHLQRSVPLQELQRLQEVAGSSESSQRKTSCAATSQSVATLDPTEEKILFGSDDSIWDAFGKSANVGMGGCNMLDGTDYFSGFPSVQSGTWSALMQSAVAETSSADVGMQEDLSEHHFRSPEPLTMNQQLPAINDGSKQVLWADNNIQLASALDTRQYALSDDANKPSSTMNSSSIPELQRPGFKNSLEPSGTLQIDSSQKNIPLLEQGKWSDHEPLQKGFSSSVETNAYNHSGSWACQQSITSNNNNNGQPYNSSSGWNFMGTMPVDGSNIFKGHGNESVSGPSRIVNDKQDMHGKVDHLSGMWRTDSTLTSNAGLEHGRSGAGSTQLGRESSIMSNVAAPNSSSIRSNQERKQKFSKSHKLDFWKAVDPSGKSGGEVMLKNLHNLDRSPQISESLLDTGLGKGAVEVHQLENSDSMENSSDSFRSGGHHHYSTSVGRENVWSDAGDSRSYLGSKQKFSNSAGRRPPGTRKFHHHPMGDVDDDIETSYGAKHTTDPRTMAQQVSRGLKGHDHGSYGQAAIVRPIDRTSIEMEKQEQSTGFQGDRKGSEGTRSKSMFPGFMRNTSATSDRPIGNYATSKDIPSSQNMLELLHKVDHSRERDTGRHLSSSDRNASSEMQEPETSDGSVGHVQQNHSSGFQGFGLQLGPPSQRLPMTDHVFSSESSIPRVFTSSRVTHEIEEKGNSKLDSIALDETLLPHNPSEGIKNDTSGHIESKISQYNVDGSSSPAIISGFPFSKNFGNFYVTAAGRQLPAHQSIAMPSDGASSRSKLIDDSYERAKVNQFVPTSVATLSGGTTQNIVDSSAEVSKLNISNQDHSSQLSQQILEQDEAPATLSSFASGPSQHGGASKVIPNAWNSVPCQQPLLGTQHTASSLFRSHLQSDNKLLATLPIPTRVNEQETLEGKSGSYHFGEIPAKLRSCDRLERSAKERHGQQVLFDSLDPAQKTSSVSQGRESTVNSFSEGSTSRRDIEAFGRSLRSNNNMHQSYSLLHQVQDMKSTEIEAGDRSVKRLKGLEYAVEHPQVGPKGEQQYMYEYNSMVRDSPANPVSGSSGDSEMLVFSSKRVESRDSNAFSQNESFSQNSSHNLPVSNSIPSNRLEHSQISPLMAPSWFDQYGTFKNGQMLPPYEMQSKRPTLLKSMEQPFKVGRLADDLHARSLVEQGNTVDICKPEDVPHGSPPTYAAKEHVNSLHFMPLDLTDQSVVGRPKKRKSATSELLPWHKELTEASRSLQTISVAESDWSRATNRLVEKLEDDAEMNEEAPMLRSKRRLILTSQLLQQLLCPPPVICLFKDACSECQSVAYFAARLAVGDTCSSITCFGSLLPRYSKRLLSEKPKVPEKVSEQYSNVVENFIGRIRKMESDFSRLDKRTSILDLRVDCQDLEKFSVINRFAKYHGRGQTDGADTSSSFTTPNVQKACPQKYVTGFPMPRNLPDRVQCQSL